MNKYVLLFRAINVGGKNLMPMKELKDLLESMDYQSVASYIQSGNVVFQAQKKPKLDELKLKLEQHFGFSPQLILLSEAEFNAVAEANPYQQCEPKTAHIYFCKDRPKLDEENLESVKKESEAYTVGEKAFYLHAPEGIGRSKLVANIDKLLAVAATGRNLNTVLKLQALCTKG
ncbi:DUF1697 domain-containing protein [Agaribacterium sp. ZY112]|uniref:DUF1697 domain-containing protein n=1 Tax=Agaribacterium sp. ZY112 TaxID=3233574 RepID=UPI003524658E